MSSKHDDLPDNAEPSAPRRGVRRVVLFDRETPTDSSIEKVTLDKKGCIVIAGRDLGETPQKFWGKPEHEYWRRIDKADVPRVLLGLIEERFDSHAAFQEWLEANSIDSELNSWSS